jgi:dihydroorotase-like cyclic amidohydrolase
MLDLVVRGGTLVVPGTGQLRADVGIAEGRIVALGEGLGGAKATFDAGGQAVLPGVVDPHVHLGNTLPFEEEAHTESRAAVIGGVTTVCVFLRRTDPYLKHLTEFRRAIDEASYVDAAFHLQIFTEEQLRELPACAEEHGVRSFKFYMSGIPGIVQSVSDAFLLEGFRQVTALGPDAVACVHAENASLVEWGRAELSRRKPGGTVADWEAAHPAEAEALAITTAAYLAGLADAHLYIVHLSSRAGLDVVRRLKRDGVRLTVETTSPYLGLSSDDPNGFLLKMVPPIRSASNTRMLWGGLLDGSIDLVGTDNTSRTRATKQPEAGLHGTRPGYAGLGTHLPALLHFGHHVRGAPLELLAERMCRTPARVFGLYPKKGTIAVGSDADLVVVDLALEREVRPEALGGMSDFSPFEGKRLRGWPVATIKGGRIVARDGKLLEDRPTGRYLPRRPASRVDRSAP